MYNLKKKTKWSAENCVPVALVVKIDLDWDARSSRSSHLCPAEPNTKILGD